MSRTTYSLSNSCMSSAMFSLFPMSACMLIDFSVSSTSVTQNRHCVLIDLSVSVPTMRAHQSQ